MALMIRFVSIVLEQRARGCDLPLELLLLLWLLLFLLMLFIIRGLHHHLCRCVCLSIHPSFRPSSTHPSIFTARPRNIPGAGFPSRWPLVSEMNGRVMPPNTQFTGVAVVSHSILAGLCPRRDSIEFV